MTKLEQKKASIDKKLDKIRERIRKAEFDRDRVYEEKFDYLAERLGELNGKHSHINAECLDGELDVYLSVGGDLWRRFQLTIDEVDYMIRYDKDLLWFLDFACDNNPMDRRLAPGEFDRYHSPTLYRYGKELKCFRKEVRWAETQEERKRMYQQE